MLAHRPRLARRLRELERAKPGDLSRLEAQLKTEVENSAAHLALRRQRAPIPTYPEDLPLVREMGRITAAIRDHQTIIVCGETGSGKSTQLPKLCL